MPQIIVTIAPDGAVTVQAAGVQGSGCQQLTAAMERALGQAQSDQKTPDFFLAASQGTGAKQNG